MIPAGRSAVCRLRQVVSAESASTQSKVLREGRVSACAAAALAAGQAAGRCRLPGQSGAGTTRMVWRERDVLAGLSVETSRVCRGKSQAYQAAQAGSSAACGGGKPVCKDGLDRRVFLRSIRNLPFGAARSGGVCKDGLDNGGNHFAFKVIASGWAKFAKRGLDRLT